MLKIIPVIFLSGIFVGLVDIFRNPHLVEKLVGISSSSILFVLFLVFVLIKLTSGSLLNLKLSKFSLTSGFVILVLACFLALLGFVNGPNYIYSKTLLNVDRLFSIGIYLLSIGLISQSNNFFKRYYKQVTFSVGLLAMVILLFFSLLPANAVDQIVKEGNLVENLQFLVLILSAIYSFKSGIRIYSKAKLIGLLFIILSLGLVVVAMDEIAWGQHLLGISTPQIVIDNNHQDELTIHNADRLAGYVPYIYMIVGLYGSFAWIFIKKQIFAPTIYLMPYFFSAFIYNFIAFFQISGIGFLSEPAELMLYSGVLIHLAIIYFRHDVT